MTRKRVVSLLPSATEVVALAGGEEVLVGRSHECDFPTAIECLPALTAANNDFESSAQMNDAVTNSLEAGQGLYRLDSPLLQQLQPDVIVTQDLCAVCAVDLSAVQRAVGDTAEIVCLNPFTVGDVLEDVMRVANALGTQQRAQAEVDELSRRLSVASRLGQACAAKLATPLKVRYLQAMRKLTGTIGTCRSLTRGLLCVQVAFLEWVEPLFPGGHWYVAAPSQVQLMFPACSQESSDQAGSSMIPTLLHSRCLNTGHPRLLSSQVPSILSTLQGMPASLACLPFLVYVSSLL